MNANGKRNNLKMMKRWRGEGSKETQKNEKPKQKQIRRKRMRKSKN